MRRLIGITPEQDTFREHERITNWIRNGKITYFHIRKPYYTEKQMRDYLKVFPLDIREKLSLNDFQYLADEFSIGGIHINRRFHGEHTKITNKRISISCHNIEDFKIWKDKVSYAFLSPILDSVSKHGYKSKFSIEELKTAFGQNILTDKVVALGGVTYNNIDTLTEIGFTNFAMLGSLWQLPTCMFIAHQNNKYDYISGSIAALEGGCRFIQLRMKDSSNDTVIKTAEILRKHCNKYGALLTIDDKIELLETKLFDGVHLGKNDMPIKRARQIIQNKFLLGATCNTIDDVKQAIKDGADYLGVGPYKFTTTKQNLSHILGLDGYKKITVYMKENNVPCPIYAIGGITLDDISALMQTGIHGIALSSTILNAPNPIEMTQEIIKIINSYER